MRTPQQAMYCPHISISSSHCPPGDSGFEWVSEALLYVLAPRSSSIRCNSSHHATCLEDVVDKPCLRLAATARSHCHLSLSMLQRPNSTMHSPANTMLPIYSSCSSAWPHASSYLAHFRMRPDGRVMPCYVLWQLGSGAAPPGLP